MPRPRGVQTAVGATPLQPDDPLARSAGRQQHDVEDSLGVLIADLGILLNRYFNRQARALELTTPQWQVLSQLYRHDGLTQTELAESLNMAKSPLGKLVDKLEKAGWVRREPDATDRRIKRIRLTARLRPYVTPLLAVNDEMLTRAIEGLSAGRVDRLTADLVRMRTNMLAALDDPGPALDLPEEDSR